MMALTRSGRSGCLRWGWAWRLYVGSCTSPVGGPCPADERLARGTCGTTDRRSDQAGNKAPPNNPSAALTEIVATPTSIHIGATYTSRV
jgi:hypothetical protein